MTTIEESVRAVARRLYNGERFLITAHRNPDGDALGSALALRSLIRQLGKDATIIVRDPFWKPLGKMPGAGDVLVAETLPADYPGGYDALFAMECPEPERTGFAILPGPVVNIDHHLGNKLYGEVNYVDLDAPSVGEMVLQLAREMEMPLDAEMATAMYVSLASDTGFFRYMNTTLRALEGATEMVRAGAKPGEISLWINESVSPGSVKLLGLCLNSLEFLAEGKIATMDLPQRFFAEAGAEAEDTEGIVNYGRTIDGVLVSALFKEVDGGTRVSMRAKPGADVQSVAAAFGGGGHKAAAGCFVPAPIGEAKAKIVSLLEEQVGRGK
ncbi:MAG TPA: bifunctional oligoribonuclease/PAP phosphatase NrnA [Thermoanaerobaculia bacterium]|nr:bifunctional oligoribonuclease/PAP phosphatase NrnA [Thermoanaerobaculia bacterium]